MTTIRTRTAGVTAGFVLAASAVLVAVAAAPSGALMPPSVLYQSANTPTQVMDVPGASHAPGTPIGQWAVNNGNNQRWQNLSFARIGETDVVVIQSVESGLVLDVAGSSTDDGAATVQNPWSGAPSQIWWVVPFTQQSAVLINMGSGKVLDVAGASHADGAPLIQWTWTGGLNQIWSPYAFIVVN